MQPGSTGGRLIPPLGQLSLDDEMNDFVIVVARVFHVSGTRRNSLILENSRMGRGLSFRCVLLLQEISKTPGIINFGSIRASSPPIA